MADTETINKDFDQFLSEIYTDSDDPETLLYKRDNGLQYFIYEWYDGEGTAYQFNDKVMAWSSDHGWEPVRIFSMHNTFNGQHDYITEGGDFECEDDFCSDDRYEYTLVKPLNSD